MQRLSVKLDASITIVSLIPVINTTPSYIDTGMVRGNQKIASFTINNTGQDVLRNARIEGPSTSWMKLTVDKNMGDIAAGGSKSVGVMFSPSDTIPQGVYDDTLVIYSDNHIPYTYHIQVTITSNAVGNVLFDVLNELMEDVPNATITFQHQTLLELIYSVKTGTDGSIIQYDIPEGRYTYTVSPPPGHSGYSGSFIVSPGMTTTVPIALEMNMVTVEWSVTPVTIEDRYEITIKQTFETNVPTPVLVVEPPNINLPDLQPGQVFNGEFKVTNYGLIEVYDVKLEFPTSLDDYDIEVMTSAIPDKLGAMKSITVPYRITRRIITAGTTTLYDEIKGYGGTSCIKTFNITAKGRCVICPNSIYQRIVEKLTTFTVAVPQLCPTYVEVPNFDTGGGGGGGIYIVPTPPGPGQVAGGNLPGSGAATIQADCCSPWTSRYNDLVDNAGKYSTSDGSGVIKYGETICYDTGAGEPKINPNTLECLKACIKEHEDLHVYQCNVQYGPTNYNYLKEKSPATLEMPAYDVEKKCLLKKINAAQPPCCWSSHDLGH